MLVPTVGGEMTLKILEGISIENLTSSCSLKQRLSEPTNLLPTSSSCIDLVFTNQPNVVMNSGVFPSIDQNCQ